MTDVRRSILWLIFCFSMILIWDQWQVHNGRNATFFPSPAKTAAAPAAATATGPASAPAPGAAAVPAPSAAGVPNAGTSPATGAPPAPTVPRERVVVDNGVMRMTFDSRGGSLVKAELLQHRDNAAGVKGTGAPIVLLDESAKRAYQAQTGWVGLKNAPTLPNHLSDMTVSGERAFAAGQNEIKLRFSATANGVEAIKTYTLTRNSHVIGVRQELRNATNAPVSGQSYQQLVRDGNKPEGESAFYFTFTGPAVYTEEKKFQKVEFKDIEKGKADHVRSSKDGYVAMVQHYFATAWLPPQGEDRTIFTSKVDTNLYAVGYTQGMQAVAPGATLSRDTRLFVGPQEENAMQQLAPGLELVKDYGWVTILAKPLFWLLDKIHNLVGNWGWSIVALVVLLKIAFYWLNHKAYSSMAKMKAINPRIMEMRERLKDKPQQMQQEMLRIYREEKVNPMGGCFPILIQIPVFIALYWVLLSSVEMRAAPWLGWIQDLAAPDPWFLLPLLMTGTTLLQTWLNPTPPDPVQAKLMWILPLVFSVMFFFFPAGLVLYWLTNNILSIAQQWFINRQLGLNK